MAGELTADDLDAMDARAAAATPAPWWASFNLEDLSWREGSYSVLANEHDPVGVARPDMETSEEQTRADAEFIAHARTNVPQLTGEVRHLRAALASANEALRVLAGIHKRIPYADARLCEAAPSLPEYVCVHCSTPSGGCVPWPCPTATVLTRTNLTGENRD